MAHKNQQDFCERVKQMYPQYFEGKRVLDVGSLDIVGCNKGMFTDCEYIGLDIGEGKNVDVICPIEDYVSDTLFDVVISTEMLEHAEHWKEALLKMYCLLKEGGLLLITAGGDGRGEHGTVGHCEWASPYTNSYYLNISNEMFQQALTPSDFSVYFVRQDLEVNDFQFYGIKKINK